jgi:acetyl-CoA C-acetyltransferase
MQITPEIWFAAGVQTPFAKVDGPLGKFDAIGLSARFPC